MKQLIIGPEENYVEYLKLLNDEIAYEEVDYKISKLDKFNHNFKSVNLDLIDEHSGIRMMFELDTLTQYYCES